MNTLTASEIRQLRQRLEHDRQAGYEHDLKQRKKRARTPLGKIAVTLTRSFSKAARTNRILEDMETNLVSIAANMPAENIEYSSALSSYATVAEGRTADTAMRLSNEGKVGITSPPSGGNSLSPMQMIGGSQEIQFGKLHKLSPRHLRSINRNLEHSEAVIRLGETPTSIAHPTEEAEPHVESLDIDTADRSNDTYHLAA